MMQTVICCQMPFGVHYGILICPCLDYELLIKFSGRVGFNYCLGVRIVYEWQQTLSLHLRKN